MAARFAVIDKLRGAAILSVFLYHCVAEWSPQALPLRNGPTFEWEISNVPKLAVIGCFGYIGVPAFFLISGFCIATSVGNEQAFQLKDFLLKRILRIYPPYLIAIGVSSLLAWEAPSVLQVCAHLGMVHNLLPGPIFYGINPSFWSIAVECQFYIAFAILCAVKWPPSYRKIVRRSFTVAVLAPAATAVIAGMENVLRPAIQNSPIVTWPIWLYGAALVRDQEIGAKLRSIVLVPISIVGLVAAQYSPFVSLYSYYFGAMLVLPVLIRMQKSSLEGSTKSHCTIFAESITKWYGGISFSMYLIHQPIIHAIKVNLKWPGQGVGLSAEANFCLFVLVCLIPVSVCSLVMFKLVEVPSIRIARQIVERNWPKK